MHDTKEISYSSILRFWTPLALMWVTMSLEMPVINAVIARMGMAKENLAIFGVVFSVSLLIEGPIIQMLSAATALTGSYENYKRLSRFLFLFVAILTSIHFLCSFSPVFYFLSNHLLNLDPEYIEQARITFLLMLPWTPAIGYRRMWQGVLIRDGRTLAVTAIMVIRIAATFIVLFAGFYSGQISGSYIAALSLSIGVMFGAVSAGLFASSTVKKKKETKTNDKPLGWRNLMMFYAPLALTSFVVMANRPVLSAGIARGLMPLESLAAWPVIISFVFLFQSFPLSFQEAAIALLSDRNTNKLRKTIFYIGISTVLVYFAVVAIPFSRIFFLSAVSGLPLELTGISVLPLLLMTLVSFASPVISWMRAVNIRKETTANIAVAVAVNLFTVFVMITFLNALFSLSGIMAAAISYTAAVCVEAIYLAASTKKAAP